MESISPVGQGLNEDSKNRTSKYLKSSPEIQSKVDTILGVIYNLPINEVKEILRIASNEVYATSDKLTSTLQFCQPAK